MPKACSNSRPSQKLGIDNSNVAVVTSPRSRALFCFQAAISPTGTAISVARNTAISTMMALTLKRSRISGNTACLVLMEKPRSPLSTALNQIRNWVTNEWSRPRLPRISARLCGSAMSPSINSAGSPGIRRINANTITEISNRVGIAIPSFCRIKRNMIRLRVTGLRG
ncbi:hypothetical protein D3C76_1236400 [compost metagenome]